MGKKYRVEIVDFEAIRMIGKKVSVKNGKTAKRHWHDFLTLGWSEFLLQNPNRISPEGDFIGWMGDYNNETKSFIEMPGIFTIACSEVPDEYDWVDIPECKMAILWITGDPENIEKGAHKMLLNKLAKTDYIEDYSYGFSMEYYTHKEESEFEYIFGYYLPCKKR